MMAVSISTTPNVTLATQRFIFDQRYAYGSTAALTNHDVSLDGRRFLMVKRESGVAYLNVVLNWFEELKRRVLTKWPGADRRNTRLEVLLEPLSSFDSFSWQFGKKVKQSTIARREQPIS